MNLDTESDCLDTKKIDFSLHWNQAYQKATTEKLGWYEANAEPTLKLIKEANLPKDVKMLHVGVGTSTLIDELIDLEYTNIIASDLSKTALGILKNRLQKKAAHVQFIVDDLTNSKELIQLKNVQLWNDRAVLHFFTKEQDRKAYFNLLKKVVAKNGFVLIAAFALDGAKKCCALDVFRYDAKMLQEHLGSDFELIQDFSYTFTNPNGDSRPYIYTLFKRTNL